MVRSASTDEKDYAKNVGKYAGAVLQQREELKEAVSRPAAGGDRASSARDFPEYLKGEDADLPKRYADELKSIRKRKL